MKNLYQEYFHIPKDKHIPTKVFMANLVLSVISIVGCTFALFATSYAWFSVNVTSEQNIIESAYYALEIEATKGAMQISDDNYAWETTLAQADKHVFKLSYNGTAKHGYCKVTLENKGENYRKVDYYTKEIGPDCFMLLGIEAAAGTKVTFTPTWGTADETRYGEVYEIESDNESGFAYLKTDEETNSQLTQSFSVVRLMSTTVEEKNFPTVDIPLSEDTRDHEDTGTMIDALMDDEVIIDGEAYSVTEKAIGKYIPGPTTPYLKYQFPQYATLEDIVEFYEVSMEDVLVFNGIEDPKEIQVGDWIRLPYVDEDAEIYVALPPDIEHEVQEGETVESIAAMYDISVVELIEYNELVPFVEEIPEDGMPVDEVYMEDVEPIYVLNPGDILLIPFYAENAYTSSDAIPEEEYWDMFNGNYWGNMEFYEPVDEDDWDFSETDDRDPYESEEDYEDNYEHDYEDDYKDDYEHDYEDEYQERDKETDEQEQPIPETKPIIPGILTLDPFGQNSQPTVQPEQSITPVQPSIPGVLILDPTGQNNQSTVQPEQIEPSNQGVLTLN